MGEASEQKGKNSGEKRAKPGNREAFELIEEMLELMEARGLVELEIDHQGLRIRLKKAISGAVVPEVESVGSSPQLQAAPIKPVEEKKGVAIKSPMVGTYYSAPAPDAPPFVEVGQNVAIGQVVCIIEAMKLMNEIKSEVSGRVLEVLVHNGDPIEFGQSLITVEPPA